MPIAPANAWYQPYGYDPGLAIALGMLGAVFVGTQPPPYYYPHCARFDGWGILAGYTTATMPVYDNFGIFVGYQRTRVCQ